MNFLGMGPMEILVIAVVGLMIFGPGKLPEVAGQVGKAVRDFKRMTADLSSEFEKTAGLDEIKRTVQKEMAGIQNEVSGVTSSVKKDLQSATKTTSAAKKPATTTTGKSSPAAVAAKTGTGTAAKSTTSTAAKTTTAAAAKPVKVEPVKASKSDPFADVSFLDDAPATSKVVAKIERDITPRVSESAPEVEDALARARARRQQAGYNRAQA